MFVLILYILFNYKWLPKIKVNFNITALDLNNVHNHIKITLLNYIVFLIIYKINNLKFIS